MGEIEVEWPWQYNFPPFFTLQPHPETRSKQVGAWKTLILEYCQKTKLYTIDIREAHGLPLFYNSSINRKLDAGVITSILSEMAKNGNAESIDKGKNRWHIYWHTLEEWSSIVYEYVNSRGMQNSVVTLFELSQGDDVNGEEFFEMNTDVLVKVLQVLEKKGRCELILSDDDQGVKFF